jgi:glycosyltransferase involved in cell wall biosynthesis
VRELLRFCTKDKVTLIFGGHPLVFFGMGLLKLIRPLIYAYWIGDFFPSSHPVIRVYERVKKWYHDRVAYAFYLSDAINRVMNGTVVDTARRRTVMWGLKPFPAAPAVPLSSFCLLFVGLIRPGQGLEALFDFLKGHADYRLSLIGIGQPAYVAELQALLNQMGLSDRVFFPNRFYSESELLDEARRCHVGIALYDTGPDNFTHYADPGKVKAYAEMHLPVLMTRISDIVPFVERFKSGEVISQITEIGAALERIRGDYESYRSGVRRFVEHFYYDRYYREAFKALEECWR